MSSYLVSPAAKPLIGSAQVPGDKSIGHRALLFGALAQGKTTITGLSEGQDNQRTRTAIAAMGIEVRELPTGTVEVIGKGLRGLSEPNGPIDCGNSGTTMRLLAGLLCAQPFATEMHGDHSLSGRPMMRVAGPLRDMGANIDGAAGAKTGEIYPPLRIGARTTPLAGIRYQQPVASAQVKSALLLAGLFAEGITEVVEPAASRDHTERMLAKMGAPLFVEGNRVWVDPTGWSGELRAGSVAVPGDPSAAAFLVAAALVAGAERVGVLDVCVNPRRTGFLDALGKLGARVELEAMTSGAGDPSANLVVTYGAADRLKGATIGGELTVRSLDEIPILAVVAARAEGVTEFRDCEELRVKESDRIATTCELLRNLGVEVEETPASFRVHGTGGKPFRAGEVHAHGDHRIAMSGVIAGLAADGPVRVHDVDNVATSFPDFVGTMRALGGEIAVE